MIGDQAAYPFPITGLSDTSETRLLDRLLRHGTTALAERGVRLVRHDDMRSLRDRHRDDAFLGAERPLPSQLDVDFCALPPDRAFWIEGLDAAGRTVLTHAARLFDWTRTDLESEGRALRIFYDEPLLHARPGADLTLAQPMPTRVAGRVAYVGGLWIHPDFRGRGLARIMPRIGRAWTHVRWAPDFAFSHVVDHLLDAGLDGVYGYPHRHRGLHFRNRYGRVFAISWVWMSASELLSDSEAFVAFLQSVRPRN